MTFSRILALFAIAAALIVTGLTIYRGIQPATSTVSGGEALYMQRHSEWTSGPALGNTDRLDQIADRKMALPVTTGENTDRLSQIADKKMALPVAAAVNSDLRDHLVDTKFSPLGVTVNNTDQLYRYADPKLNFPWEPPSKQPYRYADPKLNFPWEAPSKLPAIHHYFCGGDVQASLFTRGEWMIPCSR